MKLASFPTLKKAFDLMLLDNVASGTMVMKIRTRVQEMDLEPVDIFTKAEDELSKLSSDDLEILTCGGYDEPDCPQVSEESKEALNNLFENIHP